MSHRINGKEKRDYAQMLKIGYMTEELTLNNDEIIVI